MQYHPWYIFFLYTTNIFRTKTDIPRIFLEHECIFCGYTSRFMTQSTLLMTSLQHINPSPYTAKFMFVGVRHNKTQQIRKKDK